MRVGLSLLACVALSAQTPESPKPDEPSKPFLVNSGKPMRVELTCGDDDIQSFGLTCSTDESCPVYLELVGVEPVGAKIFLTGNLHTSTVTLFSILLASEDGGKTWIEPHERLRSSSLDQIQFLDFEAGWIGGQQSESLPRDPFLLATTDSGKTWRKLPVFSESRVGAVEQFAFETRSAGSLLVDRTQNGETGGRHELYETMTGGESWMIRESSTNPLKLKRPRLPNPDWRLRADSATHSYRLEKRNAEHWQIVASFLIASGECKPAERKLTEPPTPTEVTTPPASETSGVFVVPSKKTPPKKKRP
jgi:hypothetical protein